MIPGKLESDLGTVLLSRVVEEGQERVEPRELVAMRCGLRGAEPRLRVNVRGRPVLVRLTRRMRSKEGGVNVVGRLPASFVIERVTYTGKQGAERSHDVTREQKRPQGGPLSTARECSWAG